MTKDALYDALCDARRFIAAGEAVTFQRRPDDDPGSRGVDIVAYGAAAAHLRRASLDLTKSLAALRKSRGKY